MNDDTLPMHGPNHRYFDRKPEKLVLEGYRHWIAGYNSGSIRPWEACWNLYAVELGPRDGRRALGELSHLVRTLKRCASCPLKHFPYGSHHVCLEETLTLALISGKQNHNQKAVDICIEQLTCPMRDTSLDVAAASLGDTLFELNQVMLPIPAHVILDVINRSGQNRPSLH